MTPTVDVVIPAYNPDERDLRAALNSLRHVRGLNRIIVVDDGSAVRVHTPRRVGSTPVVLVRCNKNEGAAAARMTGARISSADCVLFMDADGALSDGSLTEAAAALLPSGYALCHLPVWPNPVYSWWVEHGGFRGLWGRISRDLAGGMLWVRTRFIACGGFPTDAIYHEHGGEDMVLAQAAAEAGVYGPRGADTPMYAYTVRHGSRTYEMMRRVLRKEPPPDWYTPALLAKNDAIRAALVERLKSSAV